jgi:hypothetical protein
MLLYEQRLYEEMRNLIPDTFAAEDQDDMVKAAAFLGLGHEEAQLESGQPR